MTESTEQQSTWRTKLKALGPGILMASAAVGGSHIVSSTQAGAIYGWQLALLIILINIFKYPFLKDSPVHLKVPHCRYLAKKSHKKSNYNAKKYCMDGFFVH
mgnify:CR=1 FL=1